MNNTSIVVPVSGDANVTTNPLKDCLKGTYKFTETVYTNVCNGKTYAVPNGFWDIASLSVLIILAAVIIIAFIKNNF